MANSIWLKSETGDYVVEDGALLNNNTLLTEAYTRIATPKNGWMYAPPGFGSDTYLFFGKRNQNFRQAVLTSIQDALAPLVTLQRARSVKVTPVNTTLGGLKFNIQIVDQVGEIVQFNYTVD